MIPPGYFVLPGHNSFQSYHQDLVGLRLGVSYLTAHFTVAWPTCVLDVDGEWRSGGRGVLVHHLADGAGTVETEAARAAHDRADHVLGALDHPKI